VGQVMCAALILRRLAALGSLAVLVGCAAGPKPLYMWETFSRQQYNTLLREGVSPADQIAALEAHAEKARAANAALPPGFRAHLGMMYMNAGNNDRARELWQAEKAAFPEITPYMDRLMRRLEAPMKTAKDAKPA
jgi:hypothetical protein